MSDAGPRRHRRHRHAPVRAHRRGVGPAAGRPRRPAGPRRRRHRVGRRPSSPSVAAATAATPTRSSTSSVSPGCRSSTSGTGAPPAAARSRWPIARSGPGAADLGLAIGFDKHPRGAFNVDPGVPRHRRVVRRDRDDADDAVLRHEDPALHARARHHRRRRWPRSPSRRIENGVAEPQRVAPDPDDRGAGRRVDDGVGPAHPVHVLLARRGRRRPRAVPGRGRPPLHRHAGVPRRGRVRHAPLRLVRGVQPVAGARAGRRPDRRRRPGRLRAGRHRARATSTSPRSRTPSRAPRSCTWPRPGCARTAPRSS